MKRFLQLILIMLITGIIGTKANDIESKLSLIMGQNNSGTEFFFTIPPCYQETEIKDRNFIKVYVGSLVETPVKLQIPGKGVEITKTVSGIEEFNIEPRLGQPVLHNGQTDDSPDAKVYEGAAIKVTSKEPVVVYVVVRYRYTSDGFLALPTSALGKHYINSAYKEPGFGMKGLFTPFTGIVGVHNETDVSFTLGGGTKDDEVPLGVTKLKSGETATEKINSGDVWLIAVDNERQDNSGSIIKSNKPIAVVSGMHCANFPLDNRWCDYAVEMESPVETWSDTYIVPTIPMRVFNGIVRIYASEDDTKIYRNGEYWLTINKGGGAPQGEGFAERRVWPKLDDNDRPNPPKPAIITGDKPISVVYYNPGIEEEMKYANNINSDPFMMNILSTDNFSTTSVFMTPNIERYADSFEDNYMNLVYKFDQNPEPKDLEFGEIINDEWRWTNFFDRFGGNVKEIGPVDGQKYGLITVELPMFGRFALRSETTEFQNYSFGYGPFDSYGFPSSGNYKYVAEEDSSDPTIVYDHDKDNNRINGVVEDFSNDGAGNIAKFYLLSDISENYELEHNFIPGISQTASFTLSVNNPDKPAKAFLYVADRKGNEKIFEFSNEDSKVLSTPSLLEPQNNNTNLPTESTLKWNYVGNYNYKLQISTDNKFNSIDIEKTIRDTSIYITDLKKGMKYYWRTKAISENAESSWSEVWSFETALNLSVYDNWEESGVEVYPNPVNDVLTLRNNNELSGMYSLTNISGAEISVGNINTGTNEINLSKVSAGTYILVIEINGNLFRYKINKVN